MASSKQQLSYVDLSKMSSQSFVEKAHFFNQLDALTRSDAEDEDISNKVEECHRKRCRAFFESGNKTGRFPRPGSLVAKDLPPANRTRSVPTLEAMATEATVIEDTPPPGKGGQSKSRRFEVSSLDETPIPDSTRAAHPTLQRSATNPLPRHLTLPEYSPSAKPTVRKRKRDPSATSARAVPESHKILHDLSFFYIPDNDVAPLRKIRIAKAQDYGARRVRTLQGATHAIVDKHLVYKDIEKILESAAKSLIVVNEDYPIDCISFRALLNPRQHRYRVNGCPASTGVLTSSPAGVRQEQLSQSTGSLPLKAPQRGQTRRATPPRSGQSSIGSLRRNSSGDQRGNPANETKHCDDADGGNPPQHSAGESQNPVGFDNSERDQPHDELTEYISLIQQYKDLPLDEDDDEVQPLRNEDTNRDFVSDSDTSSSCKSRSSGSSRPQRRKSPTAVKKSIAFEEHFACNRGGTKDGSETSSNPNARTIEVLQSMCDYYTRINDHWRTTAYRRAISTLRRQTTKVTTEDEAYRLPTIGRRLAQKIEEIVHTDRLRRLDYARSEPLDHVLQTFLGIYDVGLNRASKWVSQGFRTLDDLLTKGADLTPNQRLGIEHYDDFHARIPRAEVATLAEFVRAAARDIDPRVEIIVGGSYRRGADTSGDVDLVVTREGTSSAAELVPFLDDLLDVLTRKGFIAATLVSLHGRRRSSTRTNDSGTKWHGCCVLPPSTTPSSSQDAPASAQPRPIWRRLDILLVPETELGAAMIYFTGNDVFNRSMRLLASRKGMRLNQRGLWGGVMRGPGRRKVTEGELLEGRDERRIFEILGVRWREPGERWC